MHMIHCQFLFFSRNYPEGFQASWLQGDSPGEPHSPSVCGGAQGGAPEQHQGHA